MKLALSICMGGIRCHLIFEKLEIGRLSREEWLRLHSEIWESLAPIDQLPIPRGHVEELDRRIADADATPLAGSSWEDTRARLRVKS